MTIHWNQNDTTGVCTGVGVDAPGPGEGAAMGRWGATTGVMLVLAGAAAMTACGDPEPEASTASPLMSMFGEPDSEAEMRAKQLELEESVAGCMKAEGWEYTPIDYAAQTNDIPYEDPTTAGYGEQHGYGIVYNFVVYEWPYLDENGNYTDASPMGRSFDDPNSDYVSSLSQDEQERYYISLNGDWSKFQEPEVDDAGNEVWQSPPLDEQGCYGRAQQEIYGEQPWNDHDFNERQNELYQDLENDAAIDDAEVAWSDCMYATDAEYDFFGPNDTFTYVQNLLNDVRGLEEMPLGDVTTATAAVATMAPGNNESGTQRRPTEAELDDIEAVELKLWKVDQECLDESGLADVRREREQELVDTLRAEFPQFIQDDGDGDADDAVGGTN